MKKTIFAALTIAAIALAIPSTSHACRCFWRPFFGPRVAYRASFYQSGARVRAFSAASNCAGGACELNAATPAPCDPVEACAPVEYAPTPCENGACYLKKTTVPAPCEPVEACSGEYYPTGKSAETVAVNEMIAILNQTRAAYGVGALINDAELAAGAYNQASECASLGWLKHGSGCEILAVNSGGLRNAVAVWLQSPAHKAHLLYGGYRRAGVAVVKDQYGRAWCAVRFR